MKSVVRMSVVSLVVGVSLIFSGCGGDDSSDTGDGGSGGAIPSETGGLMVPAGVAAPPNTENGALNSTGLSELNGGAAELLSTPFSAADYMQPGIVDSFPPISGADMGGSFPQAAYLNDVARAAALDNGVQVTLTPGPNTIHASIKRLPVSGVLYPHWADFVVPAGYVATDFRVTGLTAGMAAGWTTVPGFSINDNMGNPVYSYNAAHFSLSGLRPATEFPTPLSQLVLNPLYRGTLLRPYRVFCSGVDGAGVGLTCNLIAAGPGGPVMLGSGKLQVTLTWDGANATAIASSDLDLHVIEPGLTEVYHGRRIGTYGQLDRDDTDGYGPENYFITGTPAAGDTYMVWVDNWDSTPDVNGLVRIKTDYGTRVINVNWGSSFSDKNIATISFVSGGVNITETTSVARKMGPKSKK